MDHVSRVNTKVTYPDLALHVEVQLKNKPFFLMLNEIIAK